MRAYMQALASIATGICLSGTALDARAEDPSKSTAETATPADSGVTPEYIDARIQDFETSPRSRFLISGYGTAQYVNVEGTSHQQGFRSSFNPGFHFRMADTLHFNGELELGFSTVAGEIETEVGLEFSQIDYLVNDWMVLSGGKMLTPFNAFGMRNHPTWINKLATKPPIYGGHGDVGVIPVMTQFGLQASGGATLWSENSKFNYAFYVANGPESEMNGAGSALDMMFGNSPDANGNVAGGGRVGVLPITNLEIGVSYQTGRMTDPGGRFHLVGLDGWYNLSGLELRAEYIRKSRSEDDLRETLSQNGYYAQVAYRLRNLRLDTSGWQGIVGRFEPVVRWGQMSGFEPQNRTQLAVGVAYWLFESAPLKFTYEFNAGAVRADRLVVQFAFGF